MNAPSKLEAEVYALNRDPGDETDYRNAREIAVPGDDVDRAFRLLGLESAVKRSDSTFLAGLLERAKIAHTAWEQETGITDPDWPKWYAEYLLGQR